jgi:hypothetical protein
MRGQKVLVEGNVYTVGADGIVRDVSAADAAEMLKMAASYRKPVSRTPSAKAEAAPPPAPAALAPEAASEGVKDEGGAEWPDPDESMELDYLQKMADAYDVKYDKKTTKKALVKAIHKVMFE